MKSTARPPVAAFAVCPSTVSWQASAENVPYQLSEAEVAALCAFDPTRGGRLISSLDAMHGKGARPSELNMRILSCLTDASTGEMRRLNGFVRPLGRAVPGLKSLAAVLFARDSIMHCIYCVICRFQPKIV